MVLSRHLVRVAKSLYLRPFNSPSHVEHHQSLNLVVFAFSLTIQRLLNSPSINNKCSSPPMPTSFGERQRRGWNIAVGGGHATTWDDYYCLVTWLTCEWWGGKGRASRQNSCSDVGKNVRWAMSKGKHKDHDDTLKFDIGASQLLWPQETVY
jgi:hypothetical protein